MEKAAAREIRKKTEEMKALFQEVWEEIAKIQVALQNIQARESRFDAE